MAWSGPKFKSVRDEDLIANLVTIIEEDFKLALDALYPGLDLLDLKERSLGQVLRLEFPCSAIGPNSNASSPSEDDGHLRQAFRYDIYVGVTDNGPEAVTNRIMKYMTTMGEVLRAATKNRVFAGHTGQTFGYVLETEWDYGPIGSKDSTNFRGADMKVTITVNAR